MSEEFFGKKVLSSTLLASLEKKAFLEKTASEEDLIQQAAFLIAQEVKSMLMSKENKKVILLAGKGNNAADGFAASMLLCQEGYSVEALSLYSQEECSVFCQKYAKLFLQAGGKIHILHKKENFPIEKDLLIIDALLGTGFKPPLPKDLHALIDLVNASNNPMLSVDIPSGLDGNTGKIYPTAIHAKKTLSFTSAKLGFYVQQGPNYCGKIEVLDIGLPFTYLEEVPSSFALLDEKKIFGMLPPIEKKRHKYQRGSVFALAGSKDMPGAGSLCSLAALRSGAGIVWLFSNGKIKVPFEVINYDFFDEKEERIFSYCDKAKACLIGPGLGTDEKTQAFLEKFLSQLQKPYVLDADGLNFLATHLKTAIFPYSILTPHRMEMLRLLQEKALEDEVLLQRCQAFCEEKQVILVLKGAPTFVFYPHLATMIIDRGDPALATAGTGDVLTGVIAALLAQGTTPYVAALLGVYIHGLAGEIAAKEKTSYSVIASDVIETLSEAFKKITSAFSS